MSEPDNLALRVLRKMRVEMKDMRADVASDLHNLDAKAHMARKELSEQIVGLRRAVVDCRSAAIGHSAISDLEGRLRRVEQHSNPSPSEAH